MKKLVRPPNQYPYLLFLILLFFSTTHAQSPVNPATASDYPYRESSHLRANQSPVASLTVSPTTGKAPLLITADASSSSDSDGSIVKFEWFIDGESLGVPEDVGTIKFTFQGEGTYLIAVTVTDNQGLTASKQQKIKVTTTDVVNQSPVANFTVTPTQGEAPLTVKVDASDSSDDETIASYQWQVSDGQTATGVKASFTFKTAGDYTLVLTVTDDQGLTATKQQTVQVTAKPVVNQPPVANFTVTPTQGEAPLTVKVDASDSSDEGKIASYQWQVSDGQTATGVKASFTFETAGNYTITLTVTDNKGATAIQEETVEVIAKTVQPSSTTLPSLGENFSGGIAVNDQPPQPQAVLKIADTVDVTGTIMVNSSDVGKTADIFVYAEATLPPSEDKLYFMLGEGLTISLWDKKPANLVAFQRDVILDTVQTVSMYQGNFIYPGNLKIFFGYRLPEGTLVTNSDPITITISQQGEPQFRGLVQVTPTDTDKVTLAWLPATDDNTLPEAITYQVHLSDQPNFTPSTATLQTAVTGQEKTEVLGLATGQTYNVLVVAVDQDGNESLERDYRTATTFADPVIVSQTTQFAEDKNLGLGEATTSDGVQFTYPSGGTPPQVGSVLFANVGEDTCLRKVDAVTSTADGGIVVQTSDAELTEVLEQATIASELTLFDVDKAAARSQHTAGISVRRSVRSDGSRHSEMRWQDDVLIAEQTNFSSQLRSNTSGDERFKVEPIVSFEPDVAPKFLWKLDPTTNKPVPAGVRLHIKGTLTAGIKAEFNFEEAGSVEKEVPIFKRIYRSTYWINGVPIYLVSTLSLKAVLSANASTKIHANAEATVSARLETGAQLNLDQTWKLSPPTTEFDKSFTVDVSAHGQVVGKVRLIPTLQIAYYPLRVLLVPLAVAVDASIEPILMGEVAADTIGKADLLEQLGFLKTQLTQLDFTLQEETFMGISMTVFRKTFPLLKKTQLGKTRSWVLFSLPQLSVAGGSGKKDEPIKLVATTTDGINNPFNESSVQWDVYPPGKATVSGGKTGSFTASEEGTYTVFFSGASRIPAPLGRQFAVGEVSVGKKEEDKPSIPLEGITVQVSSNNADGCGVGWFDTGMDILAGEVLTISASGEWSLGTGQYKSCDANGCGSWGQLVGKIGNGSSFPVGTSYSGTVSSNGRLFLANHDFKCEDNSGSLSVTIAR